MKLNKFWVLLCFFVVFCQAAIAEERKPVDINFKNLEIENFIKMTSKILNKNIMITTPVEGTVDFVSSKPIYDDELLDIVQSVLASKGFTLVENDVFLEVVRLSEASKYNLPVVKIDKNYKQMITQSIKLKHEDATALAANIKHLVSKSGQVVVSAENNTLLVTDFPANIKTIAEIIAVMEDGQEKEVAFIKLKNIKVQKAYVELVKIAQDAFNPKIPDQKVSVMQNVDANMIILVGYKKPVSKLKAIVERFDEHDEKTKQEMKIITLKNSEAKNTFKSIQFIVQAKQYHSKEETPVISVDEDTNSIIALGPKDAIDEIEQMIVELDKEKQQVYVQAQIIEVNEDLTNKIGAKYGLQAGMTNSGGIFGFAANTGQSTFDVLGSASALGMSLGTNIKEAVALSATIDFLKTNSAINVVSEPSLLCVNNKESSIYVGQTKSIQTSSTTSASTTSIPVVTYSREDIGLTLKIKPLISNDKKVTLDISVILEDVSETQTTNGQPDTSKKQIKTVALVRDGENVIIGGLIKDKVDNTESKVPLLGDIPLVGYAFRHNSDTTSKINLVVILTPYVIEASSDMTALREKLSKLDIIKAKASEHFRKSLEEKVHNDNN